MKKLRVATRKSELALAQCRAFVRSFVSEHPFLEVDELHVVTTGDKIVDRPLSEIGGKGLFLKEIEEALLAGEADFAVHSMKDVPPELHPDLVLSCIPLREDPRDVLVTRSGATFRDLPAGSVVGTSSLRRAVQLTAERPDLRIVPIRGNVGTRIQKCRRGDVDATVLALAGLRRLGLGDDVGEILSTDLCLPAVGQGTLAIETRSVDTATNELLGALTHHESAISARAERGLLAAVGGDCKTPVAGYAERVGENFQLRGLLAAPDGSFLHREVLLTAYPASLDEAEKIGREVGERLVRRRGTS